MTRQTRTQRFLHIRDAIMAHIDEMEWTDLAALKLTRPTFMSYFQTPAFQGPGRGFNLQIWPGMLSRTGEVYYGHKVANVDWWPDDSVDILSFHSGPWEARLLSSLNENPPPFRCEFYKVRLD